MSVIIQGPVSGLSDADQAYIDLAQATVPDASKLVDSDNLGTAALAATGDFDAAGAAAAGQVYNMILDGGSFNLTTAAGTANGSNIEI